MNARFFLAGADDVGAGPDESGLLDDSPPPLPLQLLLPLPCRCSVAEVEGGAGLDGGKWHYHLDVPTDVGSRSSVSAQWSESGICYRGMGITGLHSTSVTCDGL